MHKLKSYYGLALICAGLAVLLIAGCTPAASVSRLTPTLTPIEPGMFPQTAGTQSAAEATAGAQVATMVAQTMRARPALPTTTPPPANTQTSPPANTPTEPAPSLAPSPTTTALDTACLVGVWEVSNLADALVPQGTNGAAQPAEGLAVQNVAGRVVYTFDASGSLTITFDQLNAASSGVVNNRKVNAVETFNGSALASYQVDAPKQQIILSNFGGEGIEVGLDINGQRLAEGNLPAWQAFTSGPSTQPEGAPVKSSRALAVCSGGSLTIRVLEPVGGPELHLVRR